MGRLYTDQLDEMFARQIAFMEDLREADKLPEFPVDLTTKPGQRIIKEAIFNMIEELAEASFTLKNRVHRVTDDKTLDFNHYKEELGDALAYFLEVCIMSGIAPSELYDEYCRKNQVVADRLKNGY